MEYRIGLDIGIGSVGWSVISGSFGNAVIENFGTRIFESGEDDNKRQSLCQERRGARSVRRLERRRIHRKQLLKNHLDHIGCINAAFYDDYADIRDKDVYRLKADGIQRKLSPAELYKCLVHTCNHRGYREFYEDDTEDDAGKNKAAVSEFDRLFAASGKEIVSEYLLSDYQNGAYVQYRNRPDNPDFHYLLIRRSLLEDEVRRILAFQKQFYPQFTEENIEWTVSIIFAQRDFEDGPGDKEDEHRWYKGFLAARGNCPFYKDETRGFRNTVIADVFAVINTLSQYRYVDEKTEEFVFTPEAAKELVQFLLRNGSISMKDVQKILKSHGLKMIRSERSDREALGKAVRFLKPVRQCFENAGEVWEDWISEDQFDLSHPSRLHRIGETLSKFQTPRRRKEELLHPKKADGSQEKPYVSEMLTKLLVKKKMTGTASSSYRYMCEAICAFCNGDIYGNFQANFLLNQNVSSGNDAVKKDKLDSSAIDDREVRDNRVVFKAINETRKVLNAIIETYGTPTEIVVEVADDLGRSYLERAEIDKRQRENEKQTREIKEDIIRILGYDASVTLDDISSDMVDRYKLYYQQEGKSLYSGKPLGDLSDVLHNAAKLYEVDHIVPYSLILDNTLANKALVFADENQKKGQRTPLMYLPADQRDGYKERIHHLFSRDNDKKGKLQKFARFPVTAKKLAYLELDDLYKSEALDLLRAWKSRNINDTRYITKYIVGMIDKNLKFTENERKSVWGVKGTVTSRFRRLWLAGSDWGKDPKDRNNNLNHAIDATVIACLTPPYIEIASDAVKLRRLYYKWRKSTASAEYQEYLAKCKDKMQSYYGFSPEYTEGLLRYPERIPSFVMKLREEVDIRFNDTDQETFDAAVKAFYPNLERFVIPPHMPITSRKQNLKYQGQMTDSNPIRVENIDGCLKKIKRVPIGTVKRADIDKLFTTDDSLLSTLHRILDGQNEKYSVDDYLRANNLKVFVTDAGQRVYKVSVVSDTVGDNTIKKKMIGDGNYSILGGLKYYCFEIYKNSSGDTCLRGIQMVDIVKKNKKLYVKAETIPSDYQTHVMYLFKGDYILIIDGKGRPKFEGFTGAAFNINQNMLYYALKNTQYLPRKAITISKKDTIHKYNISILGNKGGEIKCSEPLSFIRENASGSETTI